MINSQAFSFCSHLTWKVHFVFVNTTMKSIRYVSDETSRWTDRTKNHRNELRWIVRCLQLGYFIFIYFKQIIGVDYCFDLLCYCWCIFCLYMYICLFVFWFACSFDSRHPKSTISCLSHKLNARYCYLLKIAHDILKHWLFYWTVDKQEDMQGNALYPRSQI